MKMLTLLLLAFVCTPIASKNAVSRNPEMLISASKEEKVELTIEERIITVLIDSGITNIDMQKIMIAQAKFESGNFKNRLTSEHNNVFSLHHSKNDTLSLGMIATAEGCHCFASYRSVEDATRAYLRLIARMQIPREPNIGLFARKLKERHYYGAPRRTYEQGLRYWFNSLDSTFSTIKPNIYGSTTGSQ
jgi:hypothetical protein